MLQNPPQNQAKDPTKGGSSMRDMQRQVPKRMDTEGKPVESPRLAQEQRPKAQGGQISKIARKAAKSAIQKWAIGLISGSAVAGGAVTYFTFF